jgi:hypothetical protein
MFDPLCGNIQHDYPRYMTVTDNAQISGSVLESRSLNFLL